MRTLIRKNAFSSLKPCYLSNWRGSYHSLRCPGYHYGFTHQLRANNPNLITIPKTVQNVRHPHLITKHVITLIIPILHLSLQPYNSPSNLLILHNKINSIK